MDVTATLARPVAQELLFSDVPARLSYVGTTATRASCPRPSGGPATRS
jgi:hypothetical protein